MNCNLNTSTASTQQSENGSTADEMSPASMIAEHKSEHTHLDKEGENRVVKVVGGNLHIL